MSMITNISYNLRKFRKRLRDSPTLYVAESDCDLLDQAADTIEELSEKVERQNMEQSSQYYGGGWIPVVDRLPEEHEERIEIMDTDFSVSVCHKVSDIVLVTVYDSSQDKIFVTDDCIVDGKWARYSGNCYEVLAWQPLPPKYEPKEDEYGTD